MKREDFERELIEYLKKELEDNSLPYLEFDFEVTPTIPIFSSDGYINKKATLLNVTVQNIKTGNKVDFGINIQHLINKYEALNDWSMSIYPLVSNLKERLEDYHSILTNVIQSVSEYGIYLYLSKPPVNHHSPNSNTPHNLSLSAELEKYKLLYSNAQSQVETLKAIVNKINV